MYRLKRQHDFDIVFSKGKKVYSKSLGLFYVKVPSVEKLLIGISVSKKHGNAVTRNRVKRLIRASFYPLIPHIKKGCYIVFVPKVASDYSFKAFSQDARYLLSKESLLNDVE